MEDMYKDLYRSLLRFFFAVKREFFLLVFRGQAPGFSEMPEDNV